MAPRCSRSTDLRVEFAGDGRVVQAVRGVSFSVRAGETVAVVGESGSGKTVTALAVMGLIDPPGHDHRRRGPARRHGRWSGSPSANTVSCAGANLAMVFQDPMSALNPVQRVGDQIAEALVVHGAARRAGRPDRRCDRPARARRGSFPRHGWRARTRTSSRVGCGSG